MANVPDCFATFVLGVPTLVTSPVLFHLRVTSRLLLRYMVLSLSSSHMGSVCTPAGWVNGSVETDCRQAFAVDHWSRPIRETPSWVAGSRERPVKGARCIINNEADCKEVSAEAGLSQTLVFNNWPLVIQQRRYTDLVTDVCVLESLKRRRKRVNFVAIRFVWWCKALIPFQHNSLFHVNLFLWGLVLSLLQMVNFSV